MFAATPDLQELRQGDILAATWYPRMNVDDIRLVATVDHEKHDAVVTAPQIENNRGQDWISAQTQLSRGYVMVLSHCCDLELTNNKPRGLYALVSPLIPIAEKLAKNERYLD